MITQRRFAIVRHEMSAESSPHTPSLEGASWDLLRMLLLVAEHGSIRQAALHARLDHATIRTKLDQLENLVRVSLIARRSPNQIELTDEALHLVCIARKMRQLVDGAKRRGDVEGIAAGRFVSLAISEGIAAFWLVPQLTRRIAADDTINLAISTISHSFQGIPDGNEIVVQLDRPLSGSKLYAERIASLHILPAASPDYVARHGRPQSVQELANHRLVWQTGDVTERASLDALVDVDFLRGQTVFRTGSSLAHYQAIADGCGIGLLPSYAQAVVPAPLEWLMPGSRIRRDIYMIARRESLDSPGSATVIDWVRRAFDPDRNPWFRDQFVEPSDFSADAVRKAREAVRHDRR